MGKHVAEYLRSVLLTLVVSDDTNLYFLLVAEILVVVHLAGDESVGSFGYGRVEQEVAGSATKSHRLDGTAQELVAHHTLHTESLAQQRHQVVGCQGFGQRAHHAVGSLYE